MTLESISRRRGLVVVLLAGLCGCGYGDVSHQAYEHATALYSICNRRDEARLQTYSQMLTTAQESGELTSKEAGWLAEIADLANVGEWEQATTKVRRLMTDQVQAAP